MSETRFHGARVTESTDTVTAINDVDSSVIGIVATADDADAELFPLNKPTLLTRVNDVLGKCGTTGTLYRALKAIADRVSTKVIVVRVAEHKEEDGKTQDQLVIGGSESTAHRKRTPTSLRCIPEPHRCWLIQLRKRSLKPSTVH